MSKSQSFTLIQVTPTIALSGQQEDDENSESSMRIFGLLTTRIVITESGLELKVTMDLCTLWKGENQYHMGNLKQVGSTTTQSSKAAD